VLIVTLLLLSACGGKSAEQPPAGGEGVAALDQSPNDGAGTATNEDGSDKKKGDEASKKKGEADKDKGKDENAGAASSDASGGSNGGGSAPAANNSNGSSGSSGGSSGGSSSNGSSQAAPAVPIPAGTHSYDTSGSATVSGNKRPMPNPTTLTAKAPANGQQVQIRDLRDRDGNGTVLESHLVYSEEGVYLTYVKITATFPGGFTDVRELQPAKAALIAPTGAGPGSNASFTMQGSGTKADVTIAAKRWEKLSIGGSTVNALVVNTRIVFSGAYEGRQLSTSWFWGKHVLAVKEHVKTDVENGPIRVQSEYEATLTKLP
jgi:hypothetical protein